MEFKANRTKNLEGKIPPPPKKNTICEEIGKWETSSRGKKSIETDPEMTQMSQLADSDFRAAVKNIVKDLKEDIQKTNSYLGNFS